MSADQPPECPACGKRQWPVIHSCTGVPVTAPQPGTPGSDSVHAQIAEVATTELRLVLMGRVAEEFGGRVADAILASPAMDRLRAEAKAEALEEASRKATFLHPQALMHYLVDTAAAYRTNPSSEEQS